VPLLLKQVSTLKDDGSQELTEYSVANPFTILLEISRGCYLEDVLFGKAGSLERTQVSERYR
jgi:hypothetical protein